MANITDKIGNEALNLLAPLLSPFISKVVKAYILKPLAEKNRTLCLEIVNGLYPLVDVELEKLVDKTKTPLDNAAVAGIKDALEDQARDMEFELPNLDDD